MKTLILLGMLVVGAGAQTAKPVAKQEKPPADTPKGDNSIWGTNNFTITALPDSSPCSYLGTWNAESKQCVIEVFFTPSPSTADPIACSPVKVDADGSQHMICWYKPKGAKP